LSSGFTSKQQTDTTLFGKKPIGSSSIRSNDIWESLGKGLSIAKRIVTKEATDEDASVVQRTASRQVCASNDCVPGWMAGDSLDTVQLIEPS
jgi:hypothetical protein